MRPRRCSASARARCAAGSGGSATPSRPAPRATIASTSSVEVEALRTALRETHNISSAVEVARVRGRGPASAAGLVAAFDRFDEVAADRELEQSLVVRSVERTVSELLLPALQLAARRRNADAELEHACRWATGWLHGARRLAASATRDEGVLLLDSGSPLGVEAVQTQALELPAPGRAAAAPAARDCRNGKEMFAGPHQDAVEACQGEGRISRKVVRLRAANRPPSPPNRTACRGRWPVQAVARKMPP